MDGLMTYASFPEKTALALNAFKAMIDKNK
jgi:hypothetical protein